MSQVTPESKDDDVECLVGETRRPYIQSGRTSNCVTGSELQHKQLFLWGISPIMQFGVQVKKENIDNVCLNRAE